MCYPIFILLDYVCDKQFHCSDKSDENNCEQVIISENNHKNHPPIPNFYYYNLHAHYLSLDTRIHIVDIIDISQDPGLVTIFLKLQLEWYDDDLIYSFLKDNHFMNPINKTVGEKIWIPTFGYSYLDKQHIDFRSLVIKKLNKPRLSGDIDVLNPIELYDGSKNTLKLLIYETVTFMCHFGRIDRYPFGEDKCSLHIYYNDHDNVLATFHNIDLSKYIIFFLHIYSFCYNVHSILVVSRIQWAKICLKV